MWSAQGTCIVLFLCFALFDLHITIMKMGLRRRKEQEENNTLVGDVVKVHEQRVVPFDA